MQNLSVIWLGYWGPNLGRNFNAGKGACLHSICDVSESRLGALHDGGGPDDADAIDRSFAWLADPPEITGSLLNGDANLIWRKVARREPAKLSRTAQALATRFCPSLRPRGFASPFPPGRIDCESRPYHMAWILHAWEANGRRRGAEEAIESPTT